MTARSHSGAVREIVIPGDPPLVALLGVPDAARGLVIFAHGSGSGRLSPRNNYVAACLREAGMATLLLDLLTPAEEQDRRNVFDPSWTVFGELLRNAYCQVVDFI